MNVSRIVGEEAEEAADFIDKADMQEQDEQDEQPDLVRNLVRDQFARGYSNLTNWDLGVHFLLSPPPPPPVT